MNLSQLTGKRTYIIIALGLLYVFGGDQGWWKVRESITDALMFAGLAFLRAARPAAASAVAPEDVRQGKLPLTLSVLLGAFLLTGCGTAYVGSSRARTVIENYDDNGVLESVETRESRTGPIIAHGDARSVIEKQRVSNGKTHSLGNTGAETESSGTNVAATVNSLGGAFGAAFKAAFGLP